MILDVEADEKNIYRTTSAEQIKALLKSHLEGDEDRFYSVAMQLATHEARLDHGWAEEPRKMVDDAKSLSRHQLSGTDQPLARRVCQPA